MAVAPVVICLSESGAPVAERIAAHLGTVLHGRRGRVARADVVFDNALDHARDLFAAGVPIVGVCASGILIRAVAPLLGDKRGEPPVLSVSDDGGVVVPLLGGHRGANRLAQRIADHLGAVAAVTTAGDVALGIALDAPPEGWVLATPDLARDAMARLLAGARVRLRGEARGAAIWLGALPVADDADADALVIALTSAPPRAGELTFHPLLHTLGVGCSRDCPPAELATLVRSMLDEIGVAPGAVAALHTLDLKADEPAVLRMARDLGLPLRLFDADALETVSDRLASPSTVVFAEVGCHGVAEGAALAGGGADAVLIAPKRKTAHATTALARAPAPLTALAGRKRGRLSVVGIGPGQAPWRTPEASRLIAEADELVGYGLYLDLLGPLAAGKRRADFPLGGEEARCRHALEAAGSGRNVALVCSGDAGIYAMAALVFELLDRAPGAAGVSDAARRAEVICAPGVSALQAAAARAGAPLGHDFCAISLSDLLTPRTDILTRITAAGLGDFVIAFYNPVSRNRRTLLAEAREILLAHRPADTPVLLAANLGRARETLLYRRLADLQVDEVDMLTVVLVGSSQSRLAQLGDGPRLYTPRGYARRIDGDPTERGDFFLRIGNRSAQTETFPFSFQSFAGMPCKIRTDLPVFNTIGCKLGLQVAKTGWPLDSFPSLSPLTPPLTEEDRHAWLRLLRSRRVGVVTFYRLLNEHGSAAAALDALPAIAMAAGVEKYQICPKAVVDAELRAAHLAGARPLCIGSPDYPATLTEIAEPPPMLWALGDLALLKRPAIALVGARNASSLGTRMARKLAEELGAAGHVVVSGLARGIDTAAHIAALDIGTIAVMAGGVDVVYPDENATLAQEIADRGLRLSEQPMGLQPMARHFPRRNRIVAGLARAVVVVEAAARSGSLITARDALDLGREVMAVPGHPFDGRASGCNMLIRDGASLVRCAQDVLAALPDIATPDATAAPEPPGAAKERTTESRPAPERARSLSGEHRLHQLILDRLGPSPLPEDQLIRDLALPVGDIAPHLTTLELEGQIARQPGGLLSRL